MKIYVASSWKNAVYPAVVEYLRAHGYEPFDFRHPEPGSNGFHWSAIDESWRGWTWAQYREALQHPLAEHGFEVDMAGLTGADLCVLVLPSGRSAHLEAGYAVGTGKPLVIFWPDYDGPDLMYKMGRIARTWDDLLEMVHDAEWSLAERPRS